jgi:hypothetical protein
VDGRFWIKIVRLAVEVVAYPIESVEAFSFIAMSFRNVAIMHL